MKDKAFPSRSVSTSGIIIGLVSLHYGMGFILGTGEQTYLNGAVGAVYAISTSLGLLGITALAGFYWHSRKPIWDLLGDRYGDNVRHLTNFLSWVWMIGVMASQLLGAGYALSVLGIPPKIAIIYMALAIALLGPIPLNRVAWLFGCILVISTLALLLSLVQMGGISTYMWTLTKFGQSLPSISFGSVAGIIVTTFLLTLIGMDFQQVLVAGRTATNAVNGSWLAGLALIPLAFLPTAVILGAIQYDLIGVGTINGKDAIPIIIASVGEKIFPSGGIILVIGLVLVAINSGSGLNRALIRSFQTASFVPGLFRRFFVASWLNAIVALGIAFIGFTIIGLIVSFYAIYVAGVFVPFIAFLLDRRFRINIAPAAIQKAAWAGSGFATLILIISRVGRNSNSPILNWASVSPEFWMITTGMIIATSVLLVFAIRNQNE